MNEVLQILDNNCSIGFKLAMMDQILKLIDFTIGQNSSG